MANRPPQAQLAALTAAQVLANRSINTLPVDPFVIANSCEILVQAKSPEHDGFSGMLARVGDKFGILYATHIPSLGFQRFSVAHELGHYFMPGHMDQLLALGLHVSRANFRSL